MEARKTILISQRQQRLLFLLALGLATAQGGEPSAKQIPIDGKQFRVDGKAKHGAYDVAWPVHDLIVTQREAPAAKEIVLIFAVRSPKDYCQVSLSASQWQLSQCRGGKVGVIATGKMTLRPRVAWQEFVLMRRQRYVAGVMGGQHLFRVFESSDGEGGVASRSVPEGVLGKPRYQGVSEADMVFSDDFMRTPEEGSSGAWDLKGGRWSLQSYADKWRGDSPLDPMNTARSANPFVYRGTGRPLAVALAGQPFWNDLSASVSVRSQGGRAGWVFGHRGADDYYVLWWEPTGLWEEPCRFAIERVRAGKPTVLAETSVLGQREQWYRIGVELRGGAISALLQGARLLRVVDPTCLAGRFGMCAADGQVDFDDVNVHPSELRPLEEPGLRQQASVSPAKGWQWLDEGVRCLGKEPSEASVTVGDPSWQWQRLAATIETDASCQVGLCLSVAGGTQTVFVWDPIGAKGASRRLLVRSKAGDKVVCQARGGYQPGQELRIEVVRSDSGIAIHEIGEGLLLRAPKHVLLPGRLGVVAKGKGDVTFRDLVIDEPSARDWERPVKTKIFASDHYMLDWASAEGEWTPDRSVKAGAPLWWHKGDFFGALQLSVPLAAATQSPGFKALLLANNTKAGSGYELTVASGKKGLNTKLSRQGKVVAQADFSPPKGAQTLELHRDGTFVWLRCGDAEPLSVQLDGKTLTGTRVGVQLPSPKQLEAIEVRRDHVVDDQFNTVATKWRKLGRWEVSNKFHCDPRWAYMVGESEGLATLWHQDSFPGDLTLEFYAGMRYRTEFNFMPYYPRPGDINAVIGSNGKGVFDGYTIVVSGWDTTWTRILKNGKIVAQTNRPLVPSTRRAYVRPQHLHRKWFYVKLRRVGTLLELFFDNTKVLSWRDKAPLPSGRLALWTVDDSILVARVKVAYSRKESFRPKPIDRKTEKAPEEPKLEPALRLTSSTHPGSRFTFDVPSDVERWKETGDAGDGRITWDSEGAAPGGGSLRATNANPGGQFLVRVPRTSLDLRRAHALSFAYRMAPGVRINLYLRVGGKRCFVRLTGPEECDENLKCLGAVPIKTDGKWHRVSFPLGEALAKERPRDRRLYLSSMQFGVHRGQYLLAGLGGNPAGVSFSIDDLEICSEGEAELKAKLIDASRRPVSDGTFSILKADGSKVCADQPLTGGTLTQKLADGEYLVKVKAKEQTGEATLRARVSAAPLSIASISPAPNQPWGGQPVAIRFAPGGQVPIWNLSLKAGMRSFSIDGQTLNCDLDKRELRFDPRWQRLALQNGQPCHFTLKTRGYPQKVIKEWDLVFDQTADKVPPLPVKVNEYLICNTFEKDTGSWTRIGSDRQGREHGALLIRDRERAASSRYSLRLFNELIGGVAGAQITTRSFSAGRYPVVSFDCLMTEPMTIDLLLSARGMDSRITLTDNGHRNTAYPLGPIAPDFKADGKWHHLEANWHDLIAAHAYKSSMFTVSNLRIGDNGWMGNREGAAYWIDNFRITPCFSAAGDGFTLSWASMDPGGIAGYSYHWSKKPREDADQKPEGTASNARFKGLPEGRMYFHIRAVDAAGNWGETSDWLFPIDNTPPKIKKVSPQANAEAGTHRIAVEFADPLTGVDPDSISLTINGRTFSLGRTGVELDLAKGTFSVDWVATSLCSTPPPDGQVFDVTLSSLRDFAGNRAPQTKWQWRYNRKLDKHPPLTPTITCTNASVFQQLTFDPNQQKLTATAPTWIDSVLDETLGTYVQRARVDGEGIRARVTISGKVDASHYRYLSFRYRFPPNLKVDLTGYVTDSDPEKRRMVVKLTDADVRPDYVVRAGRVEGIQRDNKWHAAIVDLKKHMELREHLPKGYQSYDWTLNNISFADVGFNWHTPGTTFYLDDVVISAPGPAKARFTFSASDESGIAGFACSFDQNPHAAPTQAVNVQPNAAFESTFPKKGIWYVHACAKDGAGNWSRAGHYTYVVE